MLPVCTTRVCISVAQVEQRKGVGGGGERGGGGGGGEKERRRWEGVSLVARWLPFNYQRV